MGAPTLLDLFCGAGGCAVGYARAGFNVIGVDVVRQAEYPFPIIYADAMTFPLAGYDAIHASPPCKRWTVARRVNDARYGPREREDLLSPMLDRLERAGVPWIVENVPGAPMPKDAIRLCGSSFGLRVRRHRLFASSVKLRARPCAHESQPHPVGVYGRGGKWTRKAAGGGGVKVVGAEAADALGTPWITVQSRISQAIPPAYTEFLGRQLLEAL